MGEEMGGSSDGRQRESKSRRTRAAGWRVMVPVGGERVVGWVHRGYGQILTIPLPRSLKRKNGGDG